MGTTGIVACTAAVLADKACGAEDKKKLNGALAATSLINAGFFAANDTMKRDVKPAMRALNIATNLGVGAYALKEALGKGTAGRRYEEDSDEYDAALRAPRCCDDENALSKRPRSSGSSSSLETRRLESPWNNLAAATACHFCI